ncbi:MAG: preprotein translocase subunit SecG [Vicingaceae bacterium]
MGTIVSVLIFMVAILLILVIMVQNPKGGLASNFSSSNQVMGVRRTADFLEKATWTLGIALVVLSIISSSFSKSVEVVEVSTDSELKEQLENIPDQIQSPPLQEEIPVPGSESDGSEE